MAVLQAFRRRARGAHWLLMSALVLGPAVLAGADVVAGGTITVHHDQGSSGYTAEAGGGGEFGVTQFSGMTLPAIGAPVAVAGSAFQTFCLETNETIPRDVPVQWTLGAHARAGGSGGGGPGGDPISPETAYLYAQFWDGALADYDYTLGAPRKASAFQLQLALWVLEEEYPEGNLDPGGDAAKWLAEARAATSTGGEWQARWGAGSIGDVRVLTLTTSAGEPLQDVLVRVPPQSPPPPGAEGGGGRTPGFWANKNGQKLIDAADLEALRALHLVDDRGRAFDPARNRDVATWLRGGKARNMAYMLSVHLAAMTLNVREGFVDADAVVSAPGCGGTLTIAELLRLADEELALHPLTPKGHASRALQECLKDALDAANNNRNFL